MPEKLDTERNGAEDIMESRIRENVRWQDFGTRITFFASQSDFDLSRIRKEWRQKNQFSDKSRYAIGTPIKPVCTQEEDWAYHKQKMIIP